MVSNRCRYISESTSDDDMADMEYTPNKQEKKQSGRKPTRIPKCFSKNALMARENRLKKKVYIANLENQVSSIKNENKKLSAIVENQSFMIDEFKKEVKYLKSVISNSRDIGKLIQAINSSTGMSVTSSLAGNPIKNPISPMVSGSNQWGRSRPEKKMYMGDIANKHPWEEKENTFVNYPTPESTSYSNPEFEELNKDDLLLGLDIPLELNNDELLGIISEKALESPIAPVEEHNYHSTLKFEQDTTDSDDDVGVCLHVSKNKVSLEFCPSCCDSALQNRKLT